MAITFRGTKGSSLTHNELDQNFREFFHSASYEGSSLLLHKFTSVSSSVSIPLTNPVGRNGAIQFKLGNAVSGANAQFTGSQNLTFVENVLKVTGSILLDTQDGSGIFEVTGSGKLTGDLTVGGTLTAEEFVTERNTTIQIYNSGSSTLGDSTDDNHLRTGSLKILGAFELDGSGSVTKLSGSFSGSFEGEGSGVTGIISSSHAVNADIAPFDGLTGKPTLLSSSIQISSDISGSVNALSASFVTTASATLNDITFTQGDGSTFVVTVDTGSGGGIGSGISDLVDDTTPQLGGNLDLNSNNISGSGNVNVVSGSFSGNLAVGTTNPSTIFYVDAGSSGNYGDFISTATNGGYLRFTSGSTIQGDFGNGAQIFSGGSKNTFGLNTRPGNSLALGTANSERVRIDTSGNVGIGTNSPVTKLHVEGTISGSAINAAGDITAFYSSDERLKDNVTPIASALDKINQIGGYEFDWNSDSEHSGHDVGVIAQEIEKVLPEVVTTRGNGYKAVRYEKIVALLIQALKEQQSQIDDLKSRL